MHGLVHTSPFAFAEASEQGLARNDEREDRAKEGSKVDANNEKKIIQEDRLTESERERVINVDG